MKTVMRKASDRFTAALFIGLALLTLTKLPGPRMDRMDILSEVLWEGRKTQGLKHLAGLLG